MVNTVEEFLKDCGIIIDNENRFDDSELTWDMVISYSKSYAAFCLANADSNTLRSIIKDLVQDIHFQHINASDNYIDGLYPTMKEARKIL